MLVPIITASPSIKHFMIFFSLTLVSGDFYSSVFLLAAAAKSVQLCPTPCDPIDGSPTGSPVPGILQARTLELGAIAFSNRNLKEGKIVLIFFVLFRIMLSPCMFFPVSVHSTDT